MPKGFADTSDPDVEAGEFPTCPSGNYKVVGVEYIKLDDDGLPYLEDNDWKGTCTLLKFVRKDEGIGPVYNATPLEIFLLVRAFGGSTKDLPKERNTQAFLTKAAEQINKGSKELIISVNDQGWAYLPKEASPPEGAYLVKVSGAYTNDLEDNLTFQPNAFSAKGGEEQEHLWDMTVIFEIAGDLRGDPSPYDGYEFRYRLRNGFNGSVNGVPHFRNTPAGALSVSASRIKKLIDCFAPELYEYQWQHADNSEFGVDEYDYPMNVIVKHAIDNKYRALAQYSYNNPRPPHKPRLVFDPKNFSRYDAPVTEGVEEEESEQELTETLVADNNSFEEEHPSLVGLVEWIYTQCPQAFSNVPVYDLDDIALTSEGVDWANNNLPELYLKAELEPEGETLRDIPEEKAEKLLEVIYGSDDEADEGHWS